MLQVLRDKGWVTLVRLGREHTWAPAVPRFMGRIDLKHWFVRVCYEGDQQKAADDIRGASRRGIGEEAGGHETGAGPDTCYGE
jgi:hypothetical protein